MRELTLTTRKNDPIYSTEYLNRDVFNTPPVFNKKSKVRELINTNARIDKLKCINILTKLESYSSDLDKHLDLFSDLELTTKN